MAPPWPPCWCPQLHQAQCVRHHSLLPCGVDEIAFRASNKHLSLRSWPAECTGGTSPATPIRDYRRQPYVPNWPCTSQAEAAPVGQRLHQIVAQLRRSLGLVCGRRVDPLRYVRACAWLCTAGQTPGWCLAKLVIGQRRRPWSCSVTVPLPPGIFAAGNTIWRPKQCCSCTIA